MMKYPFILKFTFGIILTNISACTNNSETQLKIDTTDPITVSQLIANSHKLNGHTVKVAGYYNPHFEGGSLDSSTDNSADHILIIYRGSNPTVLKGGQVIPFNKWLDWQDEPSLIQGEFTISPFTHLGLTTPNIMMIDPHMVVSIKPSEIRKIAENQGEQADVDKRASSLSNP